MGAFISRYITGTETTGNDLSRERDSEVIEEFIREKIEEFIRDFKTFQEFVRLFEEKPLIEGHLRELSGIADGLDKFNKNATIVKTAGSSVSAFGGLMTFTGLALAPVTFGASTLLAAAGVGATAAAKATNVTTEIVQACSDRDDNKRVEEIVAIIQSKMSALGETVNNACLTLSKWDKIYIEKVRLILNAGYKVVYASYTERNIASMLKTYQTLRANPVLEALAKQVNAVSSSTVRGVTGATALSGVIYKAASVGLSNGAKLAGCAVAGAFVAWDVYDITKNSIDINKGCKTERAKDIRKLVENVKGDLKNLEGVYSNMKGCM